jgi:hypothetical protein
MNDKGGSYIPKSRIKSVTTRLGKTIGGDKLKDGNGISDTKIKGRNVSSDNDDYLTKSEIRSIKTIDGRVIKSDYIKDGNLLKKTANKYPKVTRTQFEEERYSYADGGSIPTEIQRKIDGLEKFINNPENQKKDPATVEQFTKILASVKAKYKTTSTTEKKEEKQEKAQTQKPKALTNEEVAEFVMKVYSEFLDENEIESGSEIYNDFEIQKKLKKDFATKIPTKYRSKINNNVAEILTDENYHLLRNYFALNGDLDNDEKKEYVAYFTERLKKNPNSYAFLNPNVFGIKVDIEEEDEEVVDLTDIQVGDSARVISENKMGLIIKKNGKKFNLKFVNGTEKTYDASELEFIKSDNEYEEEEEEEKVSKPKSKAGRPKGTTSTKSEAKTKPQKGVKVTGSSTVSIDGKEVDMDSKEFCDYLLTKFKERREKSKNAPKKRTPSVMSKITTNVERSVVQAIKSSVESNKKAIEKNPDFFVKKVEKLESSTKSFLQSMKDVLGDDFKEKEISSTLKNIEELTESLIAKFKKK